MGPKKADKSPTKIGKKDALNQSHADGFREMSKEFDYNDCILNGKVTFNTAEMFMEMILDNYQEMLSIRKLDSMINPYIAEAGIAVSLEPSLILNFCNDDKKFEIDFDDAITEPASCPKDDYCIDRLQKRKHDGVEEAESSCDLGRDVSKLTVFTRKSSNSPEPLSPSKVPGSPGLKRERYKNKR